MSYWYFFPGTAAIATCVAAGLFGGYLVIAAAVGLASYIFGASSNLRQKCKEAKSNFEASENYKRQGEAVLNLTKSRLQALDIILQGIAARLQSNDDQVGFYILRWKRFRLFCFDTFCGLLITSHDPSKILDSLFTLLTEASKETLNYQN